LAVTGQDDLIARFSPPYQLSQLPFGVGDGICMLIPLALPWSVWLDAPRARGKFGIRLNTRGLIRGENLPGLAHGMAAAGAIIPSH
jgi:hypothetical protein